MSIDIIPLDEAAKVYGTFLCSLRMLRASLAGGISITLAGIPISYFAIISFLPVFIEGEDVIFEYFLIPVFTLVLIFFSDIYYFVLFILLTPFSF